MLLASYAGCYLFNIYYGPSTLPMGSLTCQERHKAHCSLTQPLSSTGSFQLQTCSTNAPCCPSSVSTGNPSPLPQETCSQSCSIYPQFSLLFLLHAPPCYWVCPMMHWSAFLHSYVYCTVFIWSMTLGRGRVQYPARILELTGLWRLHS